MVQNAGTLLVEHATTLGATTEGQGLISFANTGRIEAPGGADLTIAGIVSTAGLGTIDMHGGLFGLGGAIDNTGQTLSAASFNAGTLVLEGSLNGGTLLANGDLAFQTFAGYPAALLLNAHRERNAHAGQPRPAADRHGRRAARIQQLPFRRRHRRQQLRLAGQHRAGQQAVHPPAPRAAGRTGRGPPQVDRLTYATRRCWASRKRRASAP
jgi:hypothetical protein